MHCSKFAGAAQYFLLLLQKKTLAKENEPGEDFDFPPEPLEATKKTVLVFLVLSREDCNSPKFLTFLEKAF